MESNPSCPHCNQTTTYIDTTVWFCADCGHEWQEEEASNETREPTARDAIGTVLRDGDTVTLIKDLKVRGTSSVLKMGAKIKQIRIVDGDHDIDCKTDLGPMMLKSEFLKKSKNENCFHFLEAAMFLCYLSRFDNSPQIICGEMK